MLWQQHFLPFRSAVRSRLLRRLCRAATAMFGMRRQTAPALFSASRSASASAVWSSRRRATRADERWPPAILAATVLRACAPTAKLCPCNNFFDFFSCMGGPYASNNAAVVLNNATVVFCWFHHFGKL